MTITERELVESEGRSAATRAMGHAVSARYDRRRSRVVVGFNTGVELNFPARIAEGLAGASPDDLAEIEVSPAGLGLHWPRLDADLSVPALLQGVLGSKQWMDRLSAGQETAASFFARRAKGRTATDLDRLLDKVPDRPPDPGDELPEGWSADWRPAARRDSQTED